MTVQDRRKSYFHIIYLLIVRYQPLLSLLQILFHLSEICLQLGVLRLVILPQLWGFSVNFPDKSISEILPTPTKPPIHSLTHCTVTEKKPYYTQSTSLLIPCLYDSLLHICRQCLLMTLSTSHMFLLLSLTL